MAEARTILRGLIESPGLQLVPGITNVFDARTAERTGFEAVFVTGAGVANTTFGYPDIGLVTMTEMVDVIRRIVRGIEIPVIADADTGYGNHLNVIRTVSELEDAGVSAIVLEDQVAPKRCGHFDGKRVVPTGEMVEKLVAAQMARRDPDLVIVARTDAIAVEGFDSAIRRARAYREAGADVIFVEAPGNLEQVAAIPEAVAAPCLLNLVEGGCTPLVGARELERMGFKFALYANLALRVAAFAVEEAFKSLVADGSSSSSLKRMLAWEDRQRAVGLPQWQELEQRIADEPKRPEANRA